ncbi:helix-turn-helix domain-containing protein [Thermococcus barophilus]|nr:helix-turn-helix domain-containing protein [Thermococcus barophilus]
MRLLILEVWQPDCPVVYVSEKIGNIKLYAIDSHIENSNIRALLHISADDESSLQTALDIIKKHSQVKSLRVLWKCQQEICAELVCNVTNAMHSLAFAPLIFHRPLLTSRGLEKWIIVVENKTKEKEVLCCLKENNEVRIKKKISGFPSTPQDFWLITEPVFRAKLISIGDMLQLSTTQQKVLSAALEGGYYSYPRKTNLKQLSEKLGISKTAVAKNLRSVENKAMRVLAELIEITGKEY